MATMSYKEKAKLSKGTFAVPGKEGYGGKGKYPIPDEAHARNALARASQFGTPGVIAKVKAAVRRKFPNIKQGEKK